MPNTPLYFDLFQLPIDFQIDLSALNQRYHTLQKVAHPDRHAGTSATDQRLALQQSMQINAAFATLRDPLQRAIYMLELQGIENPQEAQTLQDSSFLLEQLQLREQLAQIPQQSDPLAALDHLLTTIHTQLTTQITALTTWFNHPQQPETACAAIQKMQFLYKLQQETEALETHLVN